MKKGSLDNTSNTTSLPASQDPVSWYKRYKWVLAWCAFHLCAVLLSYKEVRFFNTAGEPRTDKFWPFVKFTYPYFLPDDNTTYFKFNGFFTQYDWTECCFYIGTVLFAIVLIHVYRKSEQEG